jgi:lauroyl/myristoyl acyltransferase
MDYAVYLLALALLAVLGRLPLTLVFRLGGWLGWAAWAVLPGYRRLAHRNLTIAFGDRLNDREIRRLVRQHFCTLGANLLSVPRLARLPQDVVQSRVEMIGFDALRALCEHMDMVRPGKQFLDAKDLAVLEKEIGIKQPFLRMKRCC